MKALGILLLTLMALTLSACAWFAPAPAADAWVPVACEGVDPDECGPGGFCRMKAGACIGRARPVGECAERPQICTMDYAPVCGCDERTHSNTCAAHAAGTSVAYEGECGTPEPHPGRERVAMAGENCGGIAALRCASGLYCHMEPGVCGQTADATGLCRERPRACTREYRPVEGCDGKVYPNACTAYAAGTSVSRPAPR